MRIQANGTGAKAPSFEFSKAKVFIGIPTRGTCSIYFAGALANTISAFDIAKVKWELHYHQSSCFPCMSRNKLIAQFLKSDCTHLWFIDDDMGWNTDAIIHMLACDREFVAGIGPLKEEGKKHFACNLFTNPDGSTVMEGPPHYLMQAQYVGGAFLLLKRSVIERLIQAFPDLRSEAVDPEWGFSFFESAYRPLWLTEDYVFCDRWRACGGVIWCYPNIDFTHQGTKEYEGNYFKYRLGLVAREQIPQELQGLLA